MTRHARSIHCFTNVNEGDKVIPTAHIAKPAVANPRVSGPSRLKTSAKTLTHRRPSGARHNNNRGAYVPSVLQEER